MSRASRQPSPWSFATIAIVVLVLALAVVGIFGVLENRRLQDAAERAVQYDVAVAASGDDVKVDVLDMRFTHRNIVFSGPTDANIAEFDQTYDQLLQHIDRLDEIARLGLDCFRFHRLLSCLIRGAFSYDFRTATPRQNDFVP